MSIRSGFVELVAICKMAIQSSEVEPIYYHQLMQNYVQYSSLEWGGNRGHDVEMHQETKTNTSAQRNNRERGSRQMTGSTTIKIYLGGQ